MGYTRPKEPLSFDLYNIVYVYFIYFIFYEVYKNRNLKWALSSFLTFIFKIKSQAADYLPNTTFGNKWKYFKWKTPSFWRKDIRTGRILLYCELQFGNSVRKSAISLYYRYSWFFGVR